MFNGIEAEIWDCFALFERVLKWILFLLACYFFGENYFICFFNFMWSKLRIPKKLRLDFNNVNKYNDWKRVKEKINLLKKVKLYSIAKLNCGGKIKSNN